MVSEADHSFLKGQFDTLLEKVKDNQKVFDKFQRFELAMLSTTDLQELLEIVLYQSIRHFELSDCRLLWFEKPALAPLLNNQIIKQYGHRLTLRPDATASELFAKGKTPKLHRFQEGEKAHWFPGKTQVLSAAFVPLYAGKQLLGVLLFGSFEKHRFAGDKSTDFMAHMGLIAGRCLQGLIQQEQIQRLSMLDTLTQVKNRRCFDQDMQQEVAKARRNQQPLSCLFIDADFFKNVNDSYGHQAGDKTLQCLATWAQTQLREGDHLARFGGEEFAILLPNCDEALAMQVAERIRAFVAAQTIAFQGLEFSITLSIGVATYRPQQNLQSGDGDIIEKLLQAADEGVYDAKEGGRNRVCLREINLQCANAASV